jgi:molybdenum-dependent DNA-binding transcriptional regulator ModE
LDNTFIKEWPSIKDAASELGIDYRRISECVCGRNKTAAKYKWKYKV